MKSRARTIVFMLPLLLAACRQADGPMPEATGEVPNRLADISRDLQAVARGDAQARQDLADDVTVFVDEEQDRRQAVGELSRRAADVVSGSRLTEQSAQRLAQQLWTAAAARELSQRQVETLQGEMHALLVEVGVPEDRAENVATQVGEVQRLVTSRPKRWYEVF
jgi:hypothetical protein